MTLSNNTRRILVPIRHPVGGIRTYILYNYPILAEAGYRFTFVGPEGEVFDTFGHDMPSWDGVEFERAPVVNRKCKMRAVVRRLLKTGRFNLVCSQGFTAGVATVLANLGIGIPHVIISHDVIRPDQFPGLRGRIKRRILGHLLSRADRVVAVSEDARNNHLEYLPELGRLPDRLITITNGIDLSRLDTPCEATNTQPLRTQLKLGPDVFLMGFFGRFMEQKGFLYLVEALEQLAVEPPKPFHLVAVGSGDYVCEYRAEVERRGLSPFITFLDHVPNVTPLLKQIDLLVMPSLWEACPLLPMEALCLGVPVLGTDCVGLREVLHDTPSHTVPPRDADALAAEIRSAILTPWEEEAVRYVPVAQERFAVEKSAKALTELFEPLTTRRRQR